MRRFVTILMILGLVAGMTGAATGAKKKSKKPAVRTYEVPYSNSLAIGGVGGACIPADNCPDIAVARDEHFALFYIEDDFSPSGYVELTYDANGDGVQGDGDGPTVCGSTPEPVSVEAGVVYTAWPYLVGRGCPGSSSFSGTIKVLFSSSLVALEKAAEKL